MAKTCIRLIIAIFSLALLAAVTTADDVPIPADKSQLEAWFKANVKPLTERKGTLDPNLEVAESEPPKVIKVRQDGSGDFRTVNESINSIPAGNSKRVIVHIGPGVYTEMVKIDRTKPFITLYGSPNEMPTIAFNSNAEKSNGTVYSATLIVESDYFVAANIIVQNTSPKPTRKEGDQAVAIRVSGDKSALFNCRFLGFQDTVCDDRGFHLYKDCYIEGTVDYIFGSGTSLFINNEIRVIEHGLNIITAQARESNAEDTGYVFVHCNITGNSPNGAFLGRSWKSSPRVTFAYTDMGTVVSPLGWSDNRHPETQKTVVFGEYKNIGPAAAPGGRVPFMRQWTDEEAKPFLSLAYIVGSKWLLPPPAL